MAGGGSKKAVDVFDLNRLTEIIELMKDHGLAEVDLQQDKQKIRLSRGGGGAVAGAPVSMVAAAPAAPAAAEAAADNPNIVTINSPTVGTFYGRPNPESPSFVKVGDPVGPETVVCIVEAMKVFNEIPAEISGQIVAVLVDEEEAVDFGRPLFKVDTSK